MKQEDTTTEEKEWERSSYLGSQQYLTSLTDPHNDHHMINPEDCKKEHDWNYTSHEHDQLCIHNAAQDRKVLCDSDLGDGTVNTLLMLPRLPDVLKKENTEEPAADDQPIIHYHNYDECKLEHEADCPGQGSMVVVKKELIPGSNHDNMTNILPDGSLIKQSIEMPFDDQFTHHHDYKDHKDCKCEPCEHDVDPSVVVKEEGGGSDHDILANTLPDGLIIRQSTVPGAGQGVWTTEPLSKGQSFGPFNMFKGDILNVEDPEHAKGTQEQGWAIHKDGKYSHSIKVQIESNASWMHFVNSSLSKELQNLAACRHEGQVYYRTIRDIPANTELLVCDGQGYDTESVISHNEIECKTDACVDTFQKSTMGINASIGPELPESGIPKHDKVTNEDHIQERKRKYTGKRLYKCSACGKDFRKARFLRKHTKLHTKDKPFKCSVCGKDFKQSRYLRNHMKSHSEDKPFKCSTCGKAFQKPCALKKHMKLHTDDKPFNCSACGKEFKLPHYLQNHMTIHTGEKPYKCTICRKTFRFSDYLKQHLRIHTGEKPYVCSTCGKCFARAGNLRNHKRIHSEEKPFKCSTCGRCFRLPCTLSKHIRTHRGKKP